MVNQRRPIHLDFEVDKLTNSIENVLTKDVFATDVLPVSKGDLKNATKKSDGFLTVIIFLCTL